MLSEVSLKLNSLIWEVSENQFLKIIIKIVNQLQKFQAGEFEALNVSLHVETEIVSINRIEKHVVDKYGAIHAYDKLIMATGTRAFLPKDAPVELPWFGW